MEELNGKVAVITGGSSGIGLGIANNLAKEGVKLVLAGMSLEKAQAAATSLVAIGADAIGIACDVTKRGDLERLADVAFETFGKVDILINNAGVGNVGALHELREEDWDWVINVNLKSIYLSCSVFIKRFLEFNESALIINTGSETCFGLNGRALGSMFPYVASKHGMLGLSEMIKRDYEEFGIRVSVLCPGPVATEIWNAERSRQPEYGKGGEANPKVGELLHQLGMDPEDVGKMTVDGIKNGDYYIITHSNIGELIEKRHSEGMAAIRRTREWHRRNSLA